MYWSSVEQEDQPNVTSVNNSAKLYVVPTNYIVSCIIVVPFDLEDPDGPEQMIVAPMKTWMDAFIDEMKLRILNSSVMNQVVMY